jgi:hypothetical protein
MIVESKDRFDKPDDAGQTAPRPAHEDRDRDRTRPGNAGMQAHAADDDPGRGAIELASLRRREYPAGAV